MFWNIIKPIGSVIAATAAAKVTTDIIKGLTANKIGLQILDSNNTRIGYFNIHKNTIEKAFLAVGTFAISGAVATYVGKTVNDQIEDIETIIRELRANTDEILKEAQNGD